MTFSSELVFGLLEAALAAFLKHTNNLLLRLEFGKLLEPTIGDLIL